MFPNQRLMAGGLIARKRFPVLLVILSCVLAFSAVAELGLRVRDTENGAGVEVTQVTPGSPTAEAGLKPGDIILLIEKAPISSAEQFAQRVRGLPEGAPFTVHIAREGWERDFLLKATAAPVPLPKKFGLQLRDQPPDQVPGHGAQIVAVTPGSSSARAGLKPGDVVTQVNGRSLVRADDLISLLRETAVQDKPLRLTMAREGWEKEVLLMPDVIPKQVPSAEWESADQATHAPESESAQTGAEASGNRVLSVEPPQYQQPRVEVNLDHAAYQAYTADLKAAEAQYQQANWPAAERYYQLAIQRISTEPSSWGRLGYALIMQQKYDEAVSACKQSLALGVSEPTTLNNLGYSHWKLGALAQAKSAYLKAIELAPQWAPPYAGLGAVYLTQQDWQQAEKYYRLALEYDPDNAPDRQALDSAIALQRQVNAGQAKEEEPKRLPSDAPRNSVMAAGSVPQQDLQSLPPASVRAGRAVVQAETVPVGRKAVVAIGDFQVKAAGAGQFIGDGLREMLLTTLHNSGSYVVVERMDLQGLAAEQALSRSRMARPGAAIAESQMDVADIMVYAAVTEFENEESGSGVQVGIPKLPFTLGHQTKTAHMAIDLRVVDVTTGRLIAAQHITSEASSSQTTVGATLSVRGTAIPTSLGTFKNTPMEQAIRECVEKATAYITNSTPRQYFRHQ